jgi:hypothetical protein
VLLQGGARRLLAGPVADLVATITYNGQVQAGEELVKELEACTGDCTIVANATVLDAGVQPGTQADAPASVVTLERLDTPPGDPYQFRTTYSTAGALDNAVPSPVTLETLTEPGSMSCSVQQGGTGVALFTCRPLKALPAVTLTALAPNRPHPAERVSASVTVLNTSKDSCSRTLVVHHATHALALCVLTECVLSKHMAGLQQIPPVLTAQTDRASHCLHFSFPPCSLSQGICSSSRTDLRHLRPRDLCTSRSPDLYTLPWNRVHNSSQRGL